MKPYKLLAAGSILAIAGWAFTSNITNAAEEDTREMVELPAMMQEHMLANMRDHLLALDEMLGELSEGNVDGASKIAENRLGMSSLSSHGAEHLGKFMPEEMGAMGTEMHHAASRFVITAQNAELNPGVESQREVYKALQEITNSCNTCHQSYRIR